MNRQANTSRALARTLAHTDPEQRKELGRSTFFRRFMDALANLGRRRHAAMRESEKQVAQENQNTVFKATNGLGELYGRIPLDTYIAMQQKYGRDCWKDPNFTKAFFRDNPHLRVKTTRGTRGQEYVSKR